jgi:hypothetical protein
MAARTADPTFHFPVRLSSPAKREPLVVLDPHAPIPDDSFGAFRGLAYALIFQFLVGFVGYACWMLLRHLR